MKKCAHITSVQRLLNVKFYLIGITFSLCCVLQASPPVTNRLAIFLVAERLPHLRLYDTAPEPGGLQLFPEPILADVDFVAFDLSSQSFGITPQAATRLSLKLWELIRKECPGAPGCDDTPYYYWNGDYNLIPKDTPFVLVASDERIYMGWFYTMASAITPPGPLIEADNPFLSINVATNVWFRIEPRRIAPSRSPFSPFLPDRFAPQPSDLSLKLADVRDDRKVVTAVQELFSNRGT